MSEKKSKLAELFVQWNPNADEINEKIFKDIKYSKEQMALDLAHLKEWLKEQHHLPECRLRETDNFLTNYLTGCKGSIETVKQKLDAYYTLRGKSEVYSNRDTHDENYKRLFHEYPAGIVPKFTENGESVIIGKYAKGEIHSTFTVNSMKRFINICEIMMREGGVTNKSSITLLDLKSHSSAHAMQFTPGLMRDCLHILQNVFPSRIAKIIVINVPPSVEVLINSVIKPFLKKKLRDRCIVTSGGVEELHKYIDKSVLPKEWQGDLPITFQEINDLWKEYELTHRDWFLNELSQLTDESKRVNTGSKNIAEDSYFGVQGTLKKLVID